MQYIFIFVALVVILVSFIVSSPSSNSVVETTPQETKNVIITKANSEKQEPTPGFLIDTYITAGPKEGEIISQTNKIVFKFWGGTDQAIKGDISYETKIIGLDSKWQSNTSGERTVNLSSAGSKEYTFLVRTKADGFYDATPASITFKVVTSDNFGKVKISGISASSISLNENLAKGKSLNITGWKIKGRGGEFVIPEGVELYSGFLTDTENIILKDGQTVNIQSAHSPFISNNAFIPNKCFGYLNNTGFSYSKICPQIKEEEVCNFSEACRNAILKLNSCSRPDSSKLSSLTYDPSCQAYINDYTNTNLSYSGCVSNFAKDKDFFKSAWYVYSGFSIACKSSCGEDTIYLYDKAGLLVDKKEYK
jgi:hypothetical protein